MRKIMIMLFSFAIMVNVISCSQERNTPNDEKPTVVEPAKVTRFENNSFKSINITRENGKIIITGKARTFEGVFQYAFLSENNVVKQETYQTVGAPSWGDFKIIVNKGEATSCELFVYSAKDGAKTDVLKLPLQKK